jgi:hypothetical protein
MLVDVVTWCFRVLRICLRVLRDVTVLAEMSSAESTDLQSVWGCLTALPVVAAMTLTCGYRR